MSLDIQKKQEIIVKYQKSANDTGSPEVQIALLTARINDLSVHFKTHAQDHHSRRGLLRLIFLRRRLLDYLKRKNFSSYQSIIADLGLRR